jgi:hypothetical protein
MMKALAPIVLFLAGCASPPRDDAATITLFGHELRLETWKAVAVERSHVHADLTEIPCPMALLLGASDAMKAGLPERHAEVAEKSGKALAGMMDHFCTQLHGKAYGGAERLVLLLLHVPSGQGLPDEAVIVDCPRLQPGEEERLFKTGEFAAARERPPRTVDASLDHGWVRVRRLIPSDGRSSARYEFELFLVLNSPGPDGRTQVITRVEASTR